MDDQVVINACTTTRRPLSATVSATVWCATVVVADLAIVVDDPLGRRTKVVVTTGRVVVSATVGIVVDVVTSDALEAASRP